MARDATFAQDSRFGDCVSGHSDLIQLSRNGLVIATLGGSSTTILDAAPGIGLYQYTVTAATGGIASTPVNCSVTLPLPAPTSLSCNAIGSNIDVTWSNNSSYESLELRRNGIAIAQLGGEVSSYVDIDPISGNHDYQVIASQGGLTTASNSCSTFLELLPVTGLACAESSGVIDLAWTNGDFYSAVRIERDGLLLTTLSGTQTSFSDNNPGFGSRDYVVYGEEGAVDSTGVSCSAGVDPVISYRFATADQTIPVNESNGAAAFTQSLTIEEPNTSVAWPHDLQGFSMGLSHDDSLLRVTNLAEGSGLQALNGGNGPDYFSAEVVDSGIVVVAVFSLSNASTEVLQATSATEVTAVSYETVASHFENNPATVVTALSWSNGLGSGSLSVSNVVVVDSVGEPATFDHGLITLVPQATPETLLRGDTNIDGSINVSDAITLLDAFLFNGPTLSCLDAADTDDNGQINIADAILLLNHVFGGTQNPAAPFPNCGVDPTDNDIFDCDNGC